MKNIVFLVSDGVIKKNSLVVNELIKCALIEGNFVTTIKMVYPDQYTDNDFDYIDHSLLDYDHIFVITDRNASVAGIYLDTLNTLADAEYKIKFNNIIIDESNEQSDYLVTKDSINYYLGIYPNIKREQEYVFGGLKNSDESLNDIIKLKCLDIIKKIR